MNRCNERAVCRMTMLAQLFAIGMFAFPADAGVQEYFDDDRDAWFDDANALGPITTIGFNNLGNNVLVTEQYADLGVHFTFLGNFTRGENFDLFPQDGWGLDGNAIQVTFDTPQIGLAFDFPGAAEVDLFRDGELVHDSSRFGGSGAGRFGGVIDIEFDEAVIVDWADDLVVLDDLHFVSIPAPPTLVMVGALIAFRSRRRTPR